MYRTVTLYNNKGGVSKTTTLFNLGVYLSQQSKKILLLDCDPQCNLTELFLASDPDTALPGKELTGTSIYQALKPRFSGDTGKISVSDIHLTRSPLYHNLWLFRGDFELSVAEAYFANAINQAITENIHEKQTYRVLYRLVVDLVARHNFDHVLVDVGPSTGALSRMAFLACDAFFVPTTPDRFSNQAVSVLGKVIAAWLARHEEIVETFDPYGLEKYPGKPVFVGAISQNFKTWGGRAKKSYQQWSTQIAKTLNEQLSPASGIPIDRRVSRTNPYIAQIQDVGPLAPIAQLFGRAIYDVRQEDSAEASSDGNKYTGAVWENWKQRMATYKEEVGKLAKQL